METQLFGDDVLPQTRQTWRRKAHRELFAMIISANQKLDEESLRRLYHREAKADVGYLNAIIDYAFDAAFRAHREQLRAPTAQQVAEVARVRAVDLQKHADHVESVKRQIVLLNQQMPNGKQARYCTLDYMYRLGGVYLRVGKARSQVLVGDAYSEDEYRKKLGGLAT